MVIDFGRGHSHCSSRSNRDDDGDIDDDDDYNNGDDDDNNNGGGGNDEKPSKATGHIKLASKIFD